MSDNLDILVQNLRGERDEYPGEYVKEAAEAIDRLRAELDEKDKRIAEAEALINYAALEIMTIDQLGQWAGVRAWIENVGGDDE